MILECSGQVLEQEELRFCSRRSGTARNTGTGSAEPSGLVEPWFIKAVAAVGTVITFAGVHLKQEQPLIGRGARPLVGPLVLVPPTTGVTRAPR